MQTFIIYLKEIPHSKAMASVALASAQKHGWQAQLFAGYFRNKGVEYMRSQGYRCINETSPHYDGYSIHKWIKANDLKPGVTGCAASHIALWKRCIDLNENIAVLEHDAEVTAACPDCAFEDCLVLGPEIERIHQLGAFHKEINLSTTTQAQSLRWGFHSSKQTTASCVPTAIGYLISPIGCKKLLTDVAMSGYAPIDIQIRYPVVNLQITIPLVVQTQKQQQLHSITNDLGSIFYWIEKFPILAHFNYQRWPIIYTIMRYLTKQRRKWQRRNRRLRQWLAMRSIDKNKSNKT